jgi:hypothetical protein
MISFGFAFVQNVRENCVELVTISQRRDMG